MLAEAITHDVFLWTPLSVCVCPPPNMPARAGKLTHTLKCLQVNQQVTGGSGDIKVVNKGRKMQDKEQK